MRSRVGEHERGEGDALWFDLGEVITGCETNEVVGLVGDLNAQVDDVKTNGVVGVFRVDEHWRRNCTLWCGSWRKTRLCNGICHLQSHPSSCLIPFPKVLATKTGRWTDV